MKAVLKQQYCSFLWSGPADECQVVTIITFPQFACFWQHLWSETKKTQRLALNGQVSIGPVVQKGPRQELSQELRQFSKTFDMVYLGDECGEEISIQSTGPQKRSMKREAGHLKENKVSESVLWPKDGWSLNSGPCGAPSLTKCKQTGCQFCDSEWHFGSFRDSLLL